MSASRSPALGTVGTAPAEERAGPAPAEDGARGRAALVGHAAVVAGYLALTTLFFWPAVSHLTTRVLSDGADGASFLWSYWQIPEAVLGLDDPFSTELLFHPVGVPLAFHTNTPIESLLIGVLTRLIGIPLGVNLVMLGAVVASAVGAYLLALRECGRRWAAFVAGAAFAFLPWRLPRPLGHHNLNHTWVLPFGLLALLLLYDRPSRHRAVVLGAVLGVAFLTDFTLTLFLLLAALVVLLWRARETFTRAVGVRLLQAAVVAALVGLPLALAMARTVLAGDVDPLPGWGGADYYSSDLLSWVVPPSTSRFIGEPFAEINAEHTGGERLAYPGLTVLALAATAAVAALRRHRAQRVWVAMAAVFFVLSLGPFLKVLGSQGSHFSYLGTRFSVPLPYLGLHFVPFLSSLRVPGRFAVGAALALDVLAAVALVRLAGRRRLLGWLLPAVALALVVVEFLPVVIHPGQSPAVPRPYERIAADRSDRAVLEVPLQWRDGLGAVGDRAAERDDTLFLYYATRHGHPIVGGMVARLPQRRLERLLSIAVYRQMLTLQQEPGATDLPVFGVEDLQRLGIGFVVYHRDRPMPGVLGYMTHLGLPVAADDGTVLVWEVPPLAPGPAA